MTRQGIGLEAYTEQRMYDEGLSSLLDRNAALQREIMEGASIQIDAELDEGPLYRYAMDRRHDAIESLKALVMADPKDMVEVAVHQIRVREYLRVAGWARSVIETAEAAESELKGSDHDDDSSEG